MSKHLSKLPVYIINDVFIHVPVPSQTTNTRYTRTRLFESVSTADSSCMSSTCRQPVCNAKGILLEEAEQTEWRPHVRQCLHLDECRSAPVRPIAHLSSYFLDNFIALKHLSTVQVEAGIVQKIQRRISILAIASVQYPELLKQWMVCHPLSFWRAWPSTVKISFFHFFCRCKLWPVLVVAECHIFQLIVDNDRWYKCC